MLAYEERRASVLGSTSAVLTSQEGAGLEDMLSKDCPSFESRRALESQKSWVCSHRFAPLLGRIMFHSIVRAYLSAVIDDGISLYIYDYFATAPT